MQVNVFFMLISTLKRQIQSVETSKKMAGIIFAIYIQSDRNQPNFT